MSEAKLAFQADPQKFIEQFREKLKGCQLLDSSDEYLTKWLAARQYDMEKAEAMLRFSLEWRKLNRVDDILKTFERPEIMTKYYPMGRCGTDKFGSPVWISAQGKMDVPGILKSTTKKELTKAAMWLLESMAKEIRLENEIRKELGKKNITKQTILFDMDGLTVKTASYKPGFDLLVELIQNLEMHYPEIIRRLFFINSSKPFLFLYNVVMKPFINKETSDKIKIFGTDQSEWKSALLCEIDSDQLPAYYGGTMTDPNGDPKCPSKFNMGGTVPKEYYLINNAPTPKKCMQAVNIMAGGKKKLKFKVDKANSTLSWEFLSENGDVDFRVYYKNTDRIVEFVPRSRVQSHLFMEEGEMICDFAGEYVFEFDNSFSYLRSKKVHYFVTVQMPS